nr:AbgT family transporter [Corallincola sp.]
VLNTLLHAMGSSLAGLPEVAAGWLMLLLQSVFNFFVSSGSGQAALTMPLMAPLADLLGVGRQVAVLAFQLGDGLTNIIIPTSASLIGCLGVVKLDWGLWFRFIWRFQLWLFALASLFTISAVLIGYQ